MLMASLLTALGGVLWVYVAVVTYRGQMNAEIFMSCNERYQQIIDSVPRSAWESRLNFSATLAPPSIELTLALLNYLNLSSEEFYLYKNKFIHKRIWKIWEGELIGTLRSPTLRREWPALRSEFRSYPEFLAFVDQVQAADEKAVSEHRIAA
jgi:hypothetical protein